MPQELVLANARVVTPDAVFPGAVRARDGVIVDISEGASVPAGALDLEGDYLIPGLVELHTDNLERHLHPRPGVDWPRRAAVAAHDGEFASVGVTTVLDALRVGSMGEERLGEDAAGAAEAAAALTALGLLKAEHLIHIRCEVTSPRLLEEHARIAADPRVRMISLMDHTPGQRQFAEIEQWLKWRRLDGAEPSPAEIAATVEEGARAQAERGAPNRRTLAERARAAGVAVASHDDATEDHVAESVSLGATLAEFPTTRAAAAASRAAGLKIVMGAPNLLRGRSHSGNVSAAELAEAGLLDILSSDYAPASLMLAAFKLAEEIESWTLPRAIACVTKTPAEAVGLHDRGAIEVGRRADLARVYHVERVCVTRSLWREERRVL